MMYEILMASLRDYLRGSLTRQDLEGWLIGNLQHILDSHDPRAIEMANHVDSLLIEYQEQLIDEEGLKSAVYQLLCPKRELLYLENAQTSNENHAEEWELTEETNRSTSFTFATPVGDR